MKGRESGGFDSNTSYTWILNKIIKNTLVTPTLHFVIFFASAVTASEVVSGCVCGGGTHVCVWVQLHVWRP